MTAQLELFDWPSRSLQERRLRVAEEVLSGEYAGQGLPLVFPIEPLALQVRLAGGILRLQYEVAGRRGERLAMAFSRGLKAGYVTWHAADLLAIELLGMHPFMVWGDAWFGHTDAATR